MITKQDVEKLLEAYMGEGPLFTVSIDVSGNNDIRVLIDNDEGISIDDCVKVSRHLEGSFDREVEDFALNVSSPGADQPLTVRRQYRKNIGRDLQVKREDGSKLTGKLVDADDQKISLLTREKQRIEGRKAKQWVEETHEIAYELIKEAKVVLSFK
jgi:ribosome maturation factor RimP